VHIRVTSPLLERERVVAANGHLNVDRLGSERSKM